MRKERENENWMLCPLCKMYIDENDAEASSKTQIPEEYPVWAHVEKGANKEGNLPDHLLNSHRLPRQVVTLFAVGLGLGEFLKEHPEFEVGLPLPPETNSKKP